MQDYIEGSNTNRTNTQPREVRSQDAESVQEDGRDHGGQDDGQSAQEVGSQEPPDLRLPHGVRPETPARHRVPPRHSIFPSRDAQGSAPGQVRILGQEIAFVQKSQIPRGPQGPLAPLTAERGAAGSGRRRGPSGGTSGAVPEAAVVEGTPWCATSVSTGARGALPDPPGPALTGPARGDPGLP